MDPIDLGKQKAVCYFSHIILSTIAFTIAILSILGLSQSFLPQSKLTIWCEVLSPALFWGNLLFVIVGIIRRNVFSVQFFFNLIPVIIAFPLLFRVTLQGDSESGSTHKLKIISYNVRSFNFYTKKAPPSTEPMAEWFLNEDPDIICLQEYSYFEKGQRENLLDLLKRKYPFRVEQLAPNHSVNTGNIILSKYPILNRKSDFTEKFNDYLVWADVQIRGKEVRILNIHLQTTELNQTKQAVAESILYASDRSAHTSLINLIQTFSQNAKIRNEEAETIKQFIDLSPNPVILCGDFNATAFSYSYQTIASNMKSAFEESGQGYSYTYKPFFKMLRIDHILFPEAFEGFGYRSPSLPYSDHDPVVTEISFL